MHPVSPRPSSSLCQFSLIPWQVVGQAIGVADGARGDGLELGRGFETGLRRLGIATVLCGLRGFFDDGEIALCAKMASRERMACFRALKRTGS
jgi:hypothetical protein